MAKTCLNPIDRGKSGAERSLLTEGAAIPGTDIFVETCWIAYQAVRFCRRVIALFGYSDEDLEIELRLD